MPRHRFLATCIVTCIAVLAATGCADVSRSRDTANPATPALALAQQVCSNCHGVTGVSVSPNFPVLAAQQPAYLVSQLQAFKSHHRSDPAGFEYMWGLSRSLTEQQMHDLADYYAAQPAAPGRGRPADPRAARGAEIFRTGLPQQQVPACAGCHGAAGEGMATFPRLAGQHADYVVKQLMVFQRTDERPEGAIMKTVAHALQPDDMRDVAAFVQSMPAH